ncbi:MAG: hypothetical protein K0S21_2738 [Rhizobiaceae bacterium]|nr:hypothetical protein [Rhizobiaceae bacterium]
MEMVTLIHTRWPKDEFIYEPSTGDNIDDVDDLSAEERGALYRTAGRPLTRPANRKRISGLWGTMMMVVGGPIRLSRFDHKLEQQLLADEVEVEFTMNNRKVYAAIKGDVSSTRLYTTIERYRANDGTVNEWDIGYVRMVGRDTPYGLRVERNNSVVRTLRNGHDGICIRVLGGATAQQRGILIHEAPHVGWVIGCIGPRPHGDRRAFDNRPGNPADQTVREIVGELARRGGNGSLFVLRA